MKKIFLPLLILLWPVILWGQDVPLTSAQKVKDFEHLYQILKENYPFFGTAKRRHGVDWLSKKDEYLERVKASATDSAYIFTMKEILGKLGSGHVNFSCMQSAHTYSKTYRQFAEKDPHYQKWADMLDTPQARIKYWASILNRKNVYYADADYERWTSSYGDSITTDGKIAIMTINSFSHSQIEADKIKINTFLDKITNCNILIINIHDNRGGAHGYWKRNIVARLISEPVPYTMYPIIKDGELNRQFYPKSFVNAKILKKNVKLPNIPEELLTEPYYVQRAVDTIFPNNPVAFKRKIYVLVSKNVFSASENFVQFCKITGWATIAGEHTGGDGIGSDPVIALLPESGILFCYPALVGINSDGALNFEEGTTPDIYIEGRYAEERLNNLLNFLGTILD